MTAIEVHNRIEVAESYRVNRTKSLFNVEDDRVAEFDLEAELPLVGEEDWSIGLVVGPSGSGKTSLGRAMGPVGFKQWAPRWPRGKAIVDSIKGDYDTVTGALAAVGLGDVPAWCRPYGVLSNGEQFRASLARLICEGGKQRWVVDEFSSVVDRQIARIGSGAFAKAARRAKLQVVLLSCHHDIVEWLEPDWCFDTGEPGGKLWFPRKEGVQRPRIELDVVETGWRYWPYFAPHHYLKSGPMPFGTAYVGFVGDEPVAHLGLSGHVSGRKREARACRMVVMPEWQGAGLGMRFLNAICERELQGDGFIGKPASTLFHTAHPGLVASLRRDGKWRQLSARLAAESGSPADASQGLKWGGHLRAVSGWRYRGAKT